jgi:hypothetical protein
MTWSTTLPAPRVSFVQSWSPGDTYFQTSIPRILPMIVTGSPQLVSRELMDETMAAGENASTAWSPSGKTLMGVSPAVVCNKKPVQLAVTPSGRP